MAVLQRSVASSVLERVRVGGAGSSESCLSDGTRSLSLECRSVLEAQDRELVCRLRTYLLERGFRHSEVIDLGGGIGVGGVDAGVDVDVEMQFDEGVDSPPSPLPARPAPVVSVDMDIDVEPHAKRLLSLPNLDSSKSSRCTYRSPSPPPSASPTVHSTLSHPHLVASLIMRYRTRVAVRSDVHGLRSERTHGDGHGDGPPTGTRVLAISPLARFEPYTES